MAHILQSLQGGAENLLVSEAAHGAAVQTGPVEGPTQGSEDWEPEGSDKGSEKKTSDTHSIVSLQMTHEKSTSAQPNAPFSHCL